MKKTYLPSYLLTVAILFLVVGALHLLRVALGWDLLLAGWIVPEWLSVLLGAFVLGLSWSAFSLRS